MTLSNHPELFWLSLTIVLTGLLWVPYILQLIMQMGPAKAIWDPTGEHPHEAEWARRAKRAHYNAVENLVIIAPLILILHSLELGTKQTAAAAMIYFFARLAHFFVYTAGVPVVRTLLFLVGVGCQAVIALRLFGFI
jgi:uncharacterized MAPEG superfamily protein